MPTVHRANTVLLISNITLTLPTIVSITIIRDISSQRG